METTLSVAVTSYNSGPYLRELLESLLAQTSPPEQIVIADDGSTDSTPDMIKDFVEDAQERRTSTTWTVLDSVHHGLSGNVDRALRACTEAVISIADHDDVHEPTRNALIREAFASDPGLSFVYTDATLIDAAGAAVGRTLLETQGVSEWEREQLDRGEGFRALLRRWMAVEATSAFRRELVDQSGAVPPGWFYDGWYANVAGLTGALGFLPETTIKYRVHATNSSGVRRRGPLEKVGMLLRDGSTRNAALLRRAEDLSRQASLMRPAVRPWALELVEENLRHERARAAFPRNRLIRWGPVLAEARSGAYTRAARGRKDLLLDLMQRRS